MRHWQEKGRGNQLESRSAGPFQRTRWGDGPSLPEAHRSLPSRLRQEAQKTDDEVGSVAAHSRIIDECPALPGRATP